MALIEVWSQPWLCCSCGTTQPLGSYESKRLIEHQSRATPCTFEVGYRAMSEIITAAMWCQSQASSDWARPMKWPSLLPVPPLPPLPPLPPIPPLPLAVGGGAPRRPPTTQLKPIIALPDLPHFGPLMVAALLFWLQKMWRKPDIRALMLVLVLDLVAFVVISLS